MQQLPSPHFTQALRALNGYPEAELRQWLFIPGMGFGDREKWWQSGGTRSRPHEGLDLLFFLDEQGKQHRLPPGTAVTPLLGGVEVARSADFLGETIILAHGFLDERGRRLHTFYAHLQPDTQAREGLAVATGYRLGQIAAPAKPALACPPHLHLSLAWVAEDYPIKDFRWGDFRDGGSFRPCDPLALLR